MKRFAINKVYRDRKRRWWTVAGVTGSFPVVRRGTRRGDGHSSVRPVGGVSESNRRRRREPKLPNAETRTCAPRARVYSPSPSPLHGYVNDRICRRGISSELPLGAWRTARLAVRRKIGVERTGFCRWITNCTAWSYDCDGDARA